MRKNALKINASRAVFQQCNSVQNQFIELFSEENLDSLAREHNFIKRSRKITASSFVNALVFSEEDHKNLSLLDIKCDIFDDTNCNVSQEAIHKRFTAEAVSFLKDLFSRQISYHLSCTEISSLFSGFFNSVCIKDSSKFRLPESYIDSYPGYGNYKNNSALMNIQYEFDILSGNCKCLDLTKATRNDQLDSMETSENIETGSLNIRDLGYVTTTYLKAIDNKEAYYLNRLPKINVYQMIDNKYQKIDWNTLDKKVKKGNFNNLELEVYLGSKDKIKTRMILAPVPKNIANERVRLANKAGQRTDGYQVTKEYKIKARYNIFITNVPEQVISTENVIQAYRLRWQVELIFKTWKSNIKINKVKMIKKERMECQLIAKLIWILLNSKLLQVANFTIKRHYPHLGCSSIKFFKRAKKFSQKLKITIKNPESFINWYNTSIIPIIPHLLVEKRLNKKTHCEILADIFLA